MGVGALDYLAVKVKDKTQDPVGSRVLGTKVNGVKIG
jgi:hypothetical protein